MCLSNSPDLIARNEMKELDSRKKYYKKLHNYEETIMNIAIHVAREGLPLAFALFASIYFAIGLSTSP